MRLQARLALTVALAAAIAILVTATAAWFLGSNQQRSDVDNALIQAVSEPRRTVDLEGLVANIPVGGRGADRADGAPQVRGRFGGQDSRLFTRVRLVVGDQVVVDEGLPEIETPEAGEDSRIETVELDGQRFRMASAALTGPREGTIQVARNIEDLENGLSRFLRQIIAAGLIGIALAALLGALVARRLTAPIAQVADAAKAMVSSNDLPDSIEVTRGDEVGELAMSFNQMLAALELSREQQQRLVGDASHELRTPLTSLRLKLDLLDSTPDLPEETRRELVASSAAEVEQLGELVTELVDLATDPTGVEEQPAAQSLSRLVREVCDVVELRTGREIDLTIAGNEVDQLVRDRMVRRAVSNLLDNAAKYSGAGTPIRVAVNGKRIEVRDRGDGIPEDDLDYVFDRFYRSPSARTRPGNGIGLAIVRRVAELHGGEVWARNATDPAGAIVGFSVGSESA